MEKIVLPEQTIFELSKRRKIFSCILSLFFIVFGSYLFFFKSKLAWTTQDNYWVPSFWFIFFTLWIYFFYFQKKTKIILYDNSIIQYWVFRNKVLYYNDIIGFNHSTYKGLYTLYLKTKETSISIKWILKDSETLRRWIHQNFVNLGETIL